MRTVDGVGGNGDHYISIQDFKGELSTITSDVDGLARKILQRESLKQAQRQLKNERLCQLLSSSAFYTGKGKISKGDAEFIRQAFEEIASLYKITRPVSSEKIATTPDITPHSSPRDEDRGSPVSFEYTSKKLREMENVNVVSSKGLTFKEYKALLKQKYIPTHVDDFFKRGATQWEGYRKADHDIIDPSWQSTWDSYLFQEAIGMVNAMQDQKKNP